MRRRLMFVLPFIVFGSLAEADMQIMRDPSRGELLYAARAPMCVSKQTAEALPDSLMASEPTGAGLPTRAMHGCRGRRGVGGWSA